MEISKHDVVCVCTIYVGVGRLLVRVDVQTRGACVVPISDTGGKLWT